MAFSLSCTMPHAQDHRRSHYFEKFVEVTETIDSIVVIKSTRDMAVYHQGRRLKGYKISLGMEPIGRKEAEGDMRTPEGLYRINTRDRRSAYHANLGISYPNPEDHYRARFLGRSPGGDIKIHGFPNKHTRAQEDTFLDTDWTLGCIAVSDHEIDELYQWVVHNCPILILP